MKRTLFLRPVVSALAIALALVRTTPAIAQQQPVLYVGSVEEPLCRREQPCVRRSRRGSCSRNILGLNHPLRNCAGFVQFSVSGTPQVSDFFASMAALIERGFVWEISKAAPIVP